MLGAGESRREILIDGDPHAQVFPFAPGNVEAPAGRRQVLILGGGLPFAHQLRQAGVAPLAFAPRSFFGFQNPRALRLVFLAGARLGFLPGAQALRLFRPFARRGSLTLLLFARGAFELRRIRIDRRRNGRCGGGRRLRGGALLHVADQRAGALRARFVPGPVRHLFEVVAIRQPLHRRDAGVLEFAVQRDVEDLAAILHALERSLPHRLVLRMPRDRSEHVHVGDSRQRAPGRRFAGRSLRNRCEGFRIGQRRQLVERGEALALAHPFERFEREVAQHRNRVHPHPFVGIVARDAGKRRWIHQLCDRRSPHPRIAIVARDFRQQRALVERDFLDEGEPDGRVRMLLSRLDAESIEQSHDVLQRCTLTYATRRQHGVSGSNSRARAGYPCPGTRLAAVACFRYRGQPLNLELGQLRNDVAAMRSGTDVLVNRKNAAVGADIKRPPRGVTTCS